MATRQDGGKGCRRFDEIISAYLDDELSATELVGLEAHLRECPRCNREMDQLLSVKNALHQADPYWLKARPSHDFLPVLMERVRREGAVGAGAPVAARLLHFPFRIPRGLAPLAAAAALLILLAGAVFYLNREPGGVTPQQAARTPAAVTVAARDDSADRAVEYLREHALESSPNLLMDDVYDVALVSHERP